MAAKSPSRRRKAAAVAAIERHHGPNDPRLDEIRRELAVEAAEEFITRLVTQAPLPTPEQRDRLASLLRVPPAATPEGGEPDAA